MNNENTPRKVWTPVGHAGDPVFKDLFCGHGTSDIPTASDDPKPQVLGCAVVDESGAIYFSRAHSHNELIEDVHRYTGRWIVYDRCQFHGFYNSAGEYMTRGQTTNYMLANNLPVYGELGPMAYSYNVWPVDSSLNRPKSKSTIKRGPMTVKELMARKRANKLANRK